jgi:cell division protein FtsL
MEGFATKLDSIEKKVDRMSEDNVRKLEQEVAIQKEKLTRMEKIVYGTVAAIIANLIGIVFIWITRKN